MWIIPCFRVLGVVEGSERANPLVETKLGVIKGLYSDDGDYSMFLGIPYGKVNKSNPFGVSTAYPKFEETFLAYVDSIKCPQVEKFNYTIVGTLNCLHINIYVPSGASPSSKLPVLVWIYGGGYTYGFAGRYLYGPKYIAKENVILVTFNYRVGPYGFMCLDIPEVPGNQGLKDELLALRWINNIIESFGGDANRVTLGGESAGACGVETHLWFNQEKLFDQVILQSGSLFGPWSIPETDYTQPLKLAERLGYETKNLSDALLFLAKVDVKAVIEAATDLSMQYKLCVEKEFENVERFMYDNPRNLKVPKAKTTRMLIGHDNKECMGSLINKPESELKNMNIFNMFRCCRWINDNIEAFGGDINKITLAGQSSGAASVECHLWSKTETLFQQAILQSGSIFAPWAITEPDLTQPFVLAERLGYHTDDLSEALSFLAKTDVKLLIAAVRDLSMEFKVCVEKKFENVESFLIEHPRHSNVPKARKIPIIIGSTDKEAMELFENKPVSVFKNMNIFNETLNEIFNYDNDFFKMKDIVREFYIGDLEISIKVKDKLTDFSSDFYFVYPTQKSLQTFLDNGVEKIYNYLFTYNGKRNFTKKKNNIKAKGAAHADELSYLFHMTYDLSTPNKEDQHLIEVFTKLWTNFVKYGNPTPEKTDLIPIKWLPATKKSHRYLNINSILSEGLCVFNDRMAFWKLFYEANKNKLKGYSNTIPFQ